MRRQSQSKALRERMPDNFVLCNKMKQLSERISQCQMPSVAGSRGIAVYELSGSAVDSLLRRRLADSNFVS